MSIIICTIRVSDFKFKSFRQWSITPKIGHITKLFSFFKKKILTCLSERHSYGEKESTLQIAATASPTLGQSQEPGILSCSLLCGCRLTNTWAPFCCFFQDISRDLNRKWCNEDMDQFWYGRLALQEVLLVTPQSQALITKAFVLSVFF